MEARRAIRRGLLFGDLFGNGSAEDHERRGSSLRRIGYRPKKQPSGRDRTRNAGLFNISGLRFRGGLPYARLPALKSRAIPRRVLYYAGQRRVQGSEGCRSFRILDGAKENIAFGSKFACVQRTPYRSIATACRVRR